MRSMTRDDLPWLIELRTAPEVSRYMGGSEMQNAEALDKRIDRYIDAGERFGFGVGALVLKETGELIGTAGLIPLETTGEIEVGYSLAQHFWGMGFGFEAAMGWLDFGFEHSGLERIVAIAHPDNIGSRRIMEKCGMSYQYTAAHYGHECVFYVVSREDFRRHRETLSL